MKRILSVLAIVFISYSAIAQNVGIGTTTPNTNAALEISSNSKGILMPRLSKVVKNSMTNVAKGMLVYDTTYSAFYFHDGNKWRSISDKNTDSLLADYSGNPAVTANMTSSSSTSAQSGILYDNGGPAGNYAANSNNLYIVSRNGYNSNDSVVGYKVIIEQMNVESPYDSLEIIASPSYKRLFTGTTTGTYYFPGGGGALRFRFHSNAVNNLAGFKIIWSVLTVSTEVSDPAPLYGWYYNAKKIAVRGGMPAGNDWVEDSLGKFSFAYGYNTKAMGTQAVSFSGGDARGFGSFSMGYASEAFGDYSTAIGAGYFSPNGAYGYAATVIGMENYSGGDYSMSLGTDNKAYNNYSFAIGTTNETSGNFGVAIGHDNIVTGQHGIAIGYNTTASGNYSTSLGRQTLASGDTSFASGYNSTASGNTSFASGYRTTASGNSSVTLGRFTKANGYGATAIGDSTEASGGVSFASGFQTIASGNRSTAMGGSSTASGSYSTAMGFGTIANGHYSTALGYNTTANIYAIAMGNETIASGSASTAMGNATTASGQNSTAMGTNTIASGYHSTAMGGSTTAASFFTTTMGYGTVSNGYAGTVIGMFNNPVVGTPQGSSGSSSPLFIIGNGDDGSSLSNAMIVRKDGKVGIGTDVPRTRLHIDGGSDASLSSSSGYFLIGDVAGTNLIFDNNEIVARNNGATSTLFLQNSGGALEIGGTAAKPGGGSWAATSDARLKQNVKPYSDGLQQLLKINPVYYQYNSLSGYDTQKQYIGVLAQEIREVAPYMVGTFTKDKTEYLNVDNTAMTYMLINAVKELSQQNEELKKRLEKLEAAILKK